MAPVISRIRRLIVSLSRARGRCGVALLLGTLVTGGNVAGAAATEVPAGPATALPSQELHNLFRVTPRIYSGSAPETPAAFAELKALGVTTVLSVDGTPPNLDAAHAEGLRYIHLPFGYDGIPTNRLAELRQAVRRANGPVYVHCHHGKHRGPAAVAVICVGNDGWLPETAGQLLRQAGTSTEYPGLYRVATNTPAVSAAALAAVGELPELQSSSSVVQAMVALDQHSDRLKAALAKTPADTSAARESATLLWEGLVELGRLDDTRARPAEYRAHLATAEQAAAALRSALDKSSAAPATALSAVTKSCRDCHRAHRD